MDKEVLIHVRGLQTMMQTVNRNLWRLLYRDSIISGTEVIICAMRKSWRILQNLPSIT